MIEKQYDAVVIGGGAAGMAAALSVSSCNLKVAIIDREDYLGGILLQCIHNGFGLHAFKEDLTGPQYSQRFKELIDAADIDVFLNTTAMRIFGGERKTVIAYSGDYGVMRFSAGGIVLAMGCRERNRGNIGIPGTRPAGIFTAGFAQRLINIDGCLPGKRVVIVGSGDIGLIMARRLSWTGAKVLAVIEINPYPAGTTRNIVQCLDDFDIPLKLSHVVTRIYGAQRVEKVEVTPLDEGRLDPAGSFEIRCDTILLSVGLIPDNELSRQAGVEISPATNGPYADANIMTSVEGVFACGNVLHVHDLVDFVSEEATRCGRYVCDYIRRGVGESRGGPAVAGANVRYVLPNQYTAERENRFYLRPMAVMTDAAAVVRIDGRTVKTKKLRWARPSEMITLTVDGDDLGGRAGGTLEVSLQQGKPQ